MTFSKTITLEASGTAQAEKNELLTNRAAYTNLVPTGIYLKAGETIELNVESGRLVNYQIGTVSDYVGNDVDGKQTGKLIPGVNTITATKDGILYLSTSSLAEDSQVTITAPDTVEQIPLFTLGVNTLEDFQNLLNDYPDANAFELMGDRVLLTFSRESVASLVKDPIKTLELWDRIANLQDDLAGLTAGSDSVAGISNNLIHLVEVDNGYMFSTNEYMGFRSGVKVLDHETLLRNAWGPYHEMGHQHQQTSWTWSDMGEVTNNIYALHTQLNLIGNVAKEWTQTTVASLQASGAYDKADNFSDFSGKAQIAMFWRLYEAFGEEFYQILNQHYRTQAVEDRPTTYAEEVSQFILNACRISGYDLTEYFEAWKINVPDAVKAELATMDLKEMPLDLENYTVHDANGAYKGGLNLVELEYVIPEATAHNGLFAKAGDALGVDDLISYDPSEIASAEIRSLPDLTKYGLQYAYVDIEDHAGNRNIIPVQVFVVPADYKVASSNEVITEASDYLASLNSIDDADPALLAQHLDLLRLTSDQRSGLVAEELKQIYDERVDRAIAYIEALSKEDLIVEGGYAKLEISREAYDLLIATGDITVTLETDGAYTGRTIITEDKFTNYYSSRIVVGTDKVVIYSNSTKVGDLDTTSFKISFTPDGAFKTGVSNNITVTPEEIGQSVDIDLSTVLKDAYVELLDGKYAALTFNDEIFEEFKADGNYTVKMYVNGKYQGTVAEKGGEGASSVTQYYSGKYRNGADEDALYLNQTNLSAEDKISFTFTYRQNDGSPTQSQTVEFTGEDLGIQGKVDIDDILLNARAGLTTGTQQYASLTFESEFVQRMIADGDLRLRMFVNDTYRGEVREGWSATEGKVVSYYAGQYWPSNGKFVTKYNLDADDEIRFDIQYRQEGESEIQYGEITATAKDLGMAEPEGSAALLHLIAEDIFSLI